MRTLYLDGRDIITGAINYDIMLRRDMERMKKSEIYYFANRQQQLAMQQQRRMEQYRRYVNIHNVPMFNIVSYDRGTPILYTSYLS